MKNSQLSLLLIALALSLVVAAIAFFGWRPLLLQLSTIQESHIENERALLTEQSRQQALQSLISRRSELEQTEQALLNGFVSQDGEIDIILPLEGLGQSTGVDVEIDFPETLPSSVPQANTETEVPDGAPEPIIDPLSGLASIPVEITFTGTYREIVATIEGMEHLTLLNEILQVEFIRASSLSEEDESLPSAKVIARFFVTPM